MITGMLLGLLAGTGLLLLARGLRPPAPGLADRLTMLNRARYTHAPDLVGGTGRDHHPVAGGSGPGDWRGWAERAFGAPLAQLISRHPWLPATASSDLILLGRSPAAHYTSKTSGALCGLALPAVTALGLGAAGVSGSLLIPLWLTLTGALVGFLLPDLHVRHRAGTLRRDYHVALSAYLDLVAMRMASGAGLSEALTQSARLGHGTAFGRLRGALADARTDGLPATAVLRRLGTELALPDLVDTATRLSLVDSSGSQAEASLRAQAANLRDRELSSAHGAANERSQSMLIAQVLLGLGFLLFLGYPAVVAILAI